MGLVTVDRACSHVLSQVREYAAYTPSPSCLTESIGKNGVRFCERNPLPVRAVADRHSHRRSYNSAPQNNYILSRSVIYGHGHGCHQCHKLNLLRSLAK